MTNICRYRKVDFTRRAAMLGAGLVATVTLLAYPGAPHGLTETHKERINADRLAVARS